MRPSVRCRTAIAVGHAKDRVDRNRDRFREIDDSDVTRIECARETSGPGEARGRRCGRERISRARDVYRLIVRVAEQTNARILYDNAIAVAAISEPVVGEGSLLTARDTQRANG